jgi:hypothetical protein
MGALPFYLHVRPRILRSIPTFSRKDLCPKPIEYPDAPWFEGGEARGFRMYHVPWQQEPKALYGYLTVEPKWVEIHK